MDNTEESTICPLCNTQLPYGRASQECGVYVLKKGEVTHEVVLRGFCSKCFRKFFAICDNCAYYARELERCYHSPEMAVNKDFTDHCAQWKQKHIFHEEDIPQVEV